MKCTLMVLAAAALCSAADFQPFFSGVNEFQSNRTELLARQLPSKSSARPASVFPGDTVIPAVSAGPGTRFEMSFLSLTDTAASFTIRFFKGDGSDLFLPLAGNGRTRGGHVTIQRGEIFQLTTEKQDDFIEGFAVIGTDNVTDCIGTISRFVIAGKDGVDRSMTIPTLNKFENRTVVMLENNGGRRAFAQFMNGASRPTTLEIKLKSRAGNVISTDKVTLPPYTAVSGYLDAIYPAELVNGRSLYLDITATDFGIAAMGMETGEGFAAVIPALKNPEWNF